MTLITVSLFTFIKYSKKKNDQRDVKTKQKKSKFAFW
jgi:hypothetical protein